MNQIQLNDIPGSEDRAISNQIEALALTFAMLGALSLYSIAFWALTSNLRLTQCFPWSDGPLSNWMMWLGLAMTVNALTAKMYPTRTRTEIGSVLLSGPARRKSLAQPEELLLVGQITSGGK